MRQACFPQPAKVSYFHPEPTLTLALIIIIDLHVSGDVTEMSSAVTSIPILSQKKSADHLFTISGSNPQPSKHNSSETICQAIT